MAIKKPKILIIEQTGQTFTNAIKNSLTKIGYSYTSSSYTDTTINTKEYIKGFDIVFVSIGGQSIANAVKNNLTAAYLEGVHVFEINTTGSQSAVDASAAMYLGAATKATWYQVNIPENVQLKNDQYKIAVKSGLSTETGTFYQFNGNTSNQTGAGYDVLGSGAITLYTRGAGSTAYGVLIPKGANTSLTSETKAHFVCLGNMFNSLSSPVYTDDFNKYLASIISMMMAYFIIKGTVKDTTGNPIIRELNIYLRSDGSFIGRVTPNADGSFEYTLPVDEEIYIVAKANDDETAPTVVYDKIKPVINLY